MDEKQFDLVVIGGGINGVGVARDAAGRGLRVLLCEQKDLGWATSSASTKLIHGGLRYLEYYAFRLVRESLAEREVLLRAAPHIVRPMRFVVPFQKGMRPKWMIRLGLFLYDHLSHRRALPKSGRVNLANEPPELAPAGGRRAGFAYSDCWVDDCRLVVLNAMDAAERGGEVAPRSAVVAAKRSAGLWRLVIKMEGGHLRKVSARALVVAAGPWVDKVCKNVLGLATAAHPRLVKGSHIVTPKLHQGDHAYLLQAPDRRVVFVIPYLERFSLIGTTEVEHPSDPAVETITDQETAYLCDVVNRYFKPGIKPDQVIWSFSGLRPLFDDDSAKASAVTRDYRLVLDEPAGQPPLLTIYGGKLTTYRRLAEQVMDRLKPHLPQMGPAWTRRGILPGGDLPGDYQQFEQNFHRSAPWLPKPLANRYAAAYGTRARVLLDGAAGLSDLGRHLGDGLYEAEVFYLMEYEWAMTARDILWRRGKIGLGVSGATVENLEMWLATH